MAAKKKQAENFAFQIDVETDAQWKALCRREGLIVVDVYASWAGPCISMISTLKRVKVEANDERLWLAIANSDDIPDLLMFKDQSEPTWLFIGGGKPVKVLRGAHAPKLVSTIKAEFERELLCMQGKQKRNLISIDDEVSRRRKAEAEAIRLGKLIKEEDETAEQLNELRKESSLRLIKLMEPYTVLVVQSFLLETGVVTEIRDALQGDFKVEKERLVYLDEKAIRELFRIPYKVLDPNQPIEDVLDGEEETGDLDIGFDMDATPTDADATEGDEGEEGTEDDALNPKMKKPEKKEKKYIDIPLPEGLVGDTLIFLLESVDVHNMIEAGKTPDQNSVLQSADDYIQLKVGPINLKDAQEHAPYSFHALYGRGKYECGVWCPRRYDDKRYVMVNYFPRFVTDILVPPSEGGARYSLPADLAPEPEVVVQKRGKEPKGQKAEQPKVSKAKEPKVSKVEEQEEEEHELGEGEEEEHEHREGDQEEELEHGEGEEEAFEHGEGEEEGQELGKGKEEKLELAVAKGEEEKLELAKGEEEKRKHSKGEEEKLELGKEKEEKVEVEHGEGKEEKLELAEGEEEELEVVEGNEEEAEEE